MIVAGVMPHPRAMAQVPGVEGPPTSSAPPMKDEARAFYESGLRRYAEKDYRAAIGEFQAGYAVEPRREFLFAEAQAKRLAGDCPGAVGLYQKFLETQPPAAQVNATQMGLARCAQQMAATPVDIRPPLPSQPPLPPPLPSQLPLPQPPLPAAAQAPLWYRDPLGTTLLGAGLLSLGVGSGFLAASYAARGSGATYDEYERHWQTAEARWKVATVALAAGGLLTGAAVARYALVRRRARAGFEVTALVAPGVLLVGGRF